MLYRKILQTFLIVFFTGFLYAKENSKIIKYFQEKKYVIKEVNDFESLKKQVNENNFCNQVIYINTGQNIFGFLFDKDQYLINVFIESEKYRKLFFYLPYAELDLLDKNVFDLTLNNLYSFYFVDYEKIQVINFVLKNNITSGRFFAFKSHKYKEYKVDVKKNINYPVFNNITSINNHSFELKFVKRKKVVSDTISKIKPRLMKNLLSIVNVQTGSDK
ncbi:hypothetical protein [Flavobacterium sp. CLA17]|uniref:hypothetical protein n=1 Tax=Flavobacterium sp. CLA17 TaxID=2724135 RepID=UPI0014929C0D|nr:hypothetical protein [Flavobacterium sp. CLA17]QSB27662.1 hypothetical protein HAV12_002645 [Flavobacterium sp. CLA17]